ncbi:MAG TPA: hypothetical protein VIK13_00350 [Candidatus Limnocylindrales bacterium]
MAFPAYNTNGNSGSAETAGGPVTCSACGCRLQHAADLNGWLHFSPMAGRDARGCSVSCADEVHDARGHALSR